MSFSVSVEGFEELTTQLEEYQNKSKLELQQGIVEIIRKDVERRFISSPATTTGGTVYGGVFWRALKDSYLQRRPDRQSGQVLIDTGALRDSLTIDGARGSFVRYGHDTIEFGTEIEYAEELDKIWKLIFFHPELIQEINQFLIDYYTGEKQRPDEF